MAMKTREKRLEFDNILADLKKRANPTTTLAHDLYLAYLHQLLVEENRARYLNTKLEYQKVIDKNFPKASLLQINLKAVEFDSKLERDKTKDLEQDASNLLNSKTLPKNYRTTEHILNFLFEVAQTRKAICQFRKISHANRGHQKRTLWRNISGIPPRKNTACQLLS